MTNESPQSEFKYLAIKNWAKYQPGMDRKGRQIKAWVKDYVGKDIDDPEYSKMTMNQRYLFDACCRLRARTGRNLRNDPAWIALALGVIPKERPVLPHNIRALVERGFLVLTNEEVDFSQTETETQTETEKEKETETKPSAAHAAGSPLPSGEVKTNSFEGPNQKHQNQHQHQNPKKPCGCRDGLCDWCEPIQGCRNPAHVGDCVYYQRHVKKNAYFIDRLTRTYVIKEWKRLEADTPEDWAYDPDPLFEAMEKHLDGIDKPAVKLTRLRRKPKDTKERDEIRAKFPDMTTDIVMALYDPECEHGCDKGTVFVSDYPDAALPSQRKLGHSEICRCVFE